MVESSRKHNIRREPVGTGSQTDGNTGRKKLAGSPSRNGLIRLGSRPHPPSRVLNALKRFGKRVRTLRKEKGLTPTQLGNGCGISTLKMEKIENGQVNVALSVIVRLAQQFDMTVHQILRGVK